MTQSVIVLGGYNGANTPIPVAGGGGGGATQVEGRAADGAAVTGNPVLCGGFDGVNAQTFLTDNAGRQQVIGAAADGAAVAGNPVLIAGQDGTNAQSLKVDTTGRPEVVGPSVVGAAPVGNPIYVAGDDGTNIRGVRLDTSGRTVVAGAAADGAAVAGNPVLCGGFDGTNAQTFLTDASGRQQVVGAGATGAAVTGNPVLIAGTDGTNAQVPGMTNLTADGVTPTQPALNANALQLCYNGTSWDRAYNNQEITALASAARTVLTTSADFVCYNGHGIIAILNITVASGTGGLALTIQGKDSVSGTYYNLNTTPAAVVATGVRIYEVGQGNGTTTSGDVTQRTNGLIPRTFRIRVAVGDASSYTYSVGVVVV